MSAGLFFWNQVAIETIAPYDYAVQQKRTSGILARDKLVGEPITGQYLVFFEGLTLDDVYHAPNGLAVSPERSCTLAWMPIQFFSQYDAGFRLRPGSKHLVELER